MSRILVNLDIPSSGKVVYQGKELNKLARSKRREIQLVFQDPFASLDPRMQVGHTVTEGPLAHGLTSKFRAKEYASNWFKRVGLDPVCVLSNKV